MKNHNAKKQISLFIIVAVILSALSSCAEKPNEPQAESVYANAENWAYLETDTDGKDADVFFIAPTVYRGDEETFNWLEYDEKIKPKFIGATTMEKGIYDENARFFAPFYHQTSLSSLNLSEEERLKCVDIAYADVRDAFLYYMDTYNEGRPLILAGFSQGGEMCIRLMKEFFGDAKYSDLLVACYAIGWRITEEELEEYPQIKFAEGEDDTGVFITFNSEAEWINGSPVVPEGTKTVSINPINWKRDSTPGDKSENLGSCALDYSGEIKSEIKELTGAYIDPVRGTLKITDVSPEEYPGSLFDDGIYHVYECQFFYRNLQKNVSVRLNEFLNK